MVREKSSPACHLAPARLRTDRVNMLHKVARAPLLATDGAYAPDGRTFVIRTYYAAHVYSAPDRLLRIVSLPSQEQGESIAYSADGRSLLVGSEGQNQPVYRVPLPGEALPTPSVSARAAAGRQAEKRRWPSGARSAALLVALGVGGAIAYGVLRGRS